MLNEPKPGLDAAVAASGSPDVSHVMIWCQYSDPDRLRLLHTLAFRC